MFRSGILYCAFHFSALAGVPVTMPARRQYFVCCNAGAISWVLRLPRPTRATPSFLSGSAAKTCGAITPANGTVAAARVVVLRKSRRDWNRAYMLEISYNYTKGTTRKNARKRDGLACHAKAK